MNHTKPPAKAALNPRRRRHLLTVHALTGAIQKILTPDLLKPKFREGNATNPLLGHCYHSAEALNQFIQTLQLQEQRCGYRLCRGVIGNNSAP
jgi:hypothetical protein